jgi:hypothetical protein
MPIDPKDVPYLNPPERTEVVEPTCLNCGETRDNHAGDHCLLNASVWRTDPRSLLDTNAKPMIRDPDLMDQLPPRLQEEEADPDDPMVKMLKNAIKN